MLAPAKEEPRLESLKRLEHEYSQLVQTLMVIAVEHAGAERGLLILPDGEEFRIAAEARTPAATRLRSTCNRRR